VSLATVVAAAKIILFCDLKVVSRLISSK
jgi:hypothetical protein